MIAKTLIMVALTIVVAPLYAAIDFYEDGEVSEGDDYDFVSVYLTSVVDVLGGHIGWLQGHDTSVINVYGGRIGNLSANDSVVYNLYSGDISAGFIGVDESSLINVYGTDFSTYIANSRIFLTGTWEDESTFDFFFYRTLEIPENVKLHEIPEPATIVLLLQSLLFCRVRKHF